MNRWLPGRFRCLNYAIKLRRCADLVVVWYYLDWDTATAVFASGWNRSFISTGWPSPGESTAMEPPMERLALQSYVNTREADTRPQTRLHSKTTLVGMVWLYSSLMAAWNGFTDLAFSWVDISYKLHQSGSCGKQFVNRQIRRQGLWSSEICWDLRTPCKSEGDDSRLWNTRLPVSLWFSLRWNLSVPENWKNLNQKCRIRLAVGFTARNAFPLKKHGASG